jgi:hypothetical protein
MQKIKHCMPSVGITSETCPSGGDWPCSQPGATLTAAVVATTVNAIAQGILSRRMPAVYAC